MDLNNSTLMEKAQLIGIAPEMLSEILILFFDKLPDQVKEMKEAIEKEDYHTLHVTSHTIKGTASNLYYEKIIEISREIEQAALAQSCFGCPQLFEDLLIALAQAKEEVAA